MIWGVFVVLLLVGGFFWFARPGASEADKRRLQTLTDEHAQLAVRVVDLSDRADRYREGEGATGAAFASAEAIFTRVTAQWSAVTEQLDAIKQAAAKKDLEPLRSKGSALEQQIKAMARVLDEFAAALDTYQATWEAAPGVVDQVASELDALAAEIGQVEATLGFTTDLGKQLSAMQAFRAKARDLLRTNPTEARLKAEDLRLAMDRCRDELQRYQSAAGAIAGTQAEIAETRAAAAAAGKLEEPAVAAALAAADVAHAKVLPALQAGHDSVLQDALLAIQEALRTARRALKG